MSDILVIGGDLPKRFVFCPNCRRGTFVECDFPVMLRNHGDIPLPSGWSWVARDIALDEGKIKALVPTCPVCTGLVESPADLERVHDEARDLKF